MSVIEEFREKLAHGIHQQEEEELRAACLAFAGTDDPKELIGRVERFKYMHAPYEDFMVDGWLALRIYPFELMERYDLDNFSHTVTWKRDFYRAWQEKLNQDTGGGCSICGSTPCRLITGTYWLCEDCK